MTVLPIVTGALRTISGYTKAGNGRLSLPDIFGSARLSAVLGTAHIVRKVSCDYAAGLLLFTEVEVKTGIFIEPRSGEIKTHH